MSQRKEVICDTIPTRSFKRARSVETKQYFYSTAETEYVIMDGIAGEQAGKLRQRNSSESCHDEPGPGLLGVQ